MARIEDLGAVIGAQSVHRGRNGTDMRFLWLGWTLLFVAPACSPEPSTGPSEPEWSLGSDPLLTITGETDPEGPLHSVGGAVKLDTGILVADRGSHQLRLYSMDGQLLETTGRAGEGPAEFRSPRIAGRLPADTVIVFDGRNRRVTTVCNGTAICGERLLPLASEVHGVIGEYIAFETSRANLGSLGVTAQIHTYLMTTRNGEEVDTLLELDGRPNVVGVVGGRSASFPLPLAMAPLAAATQTGLLVSDGRSPVLRVLGPKGVEGGTIPLPIPVRPLDRRDFQREVERIVERWRGPEQEDLRALFQSATAPATLPPIYGLAVDRTGKLWVRLNRDMDAGIEWLVTDESGAAIGRVSTPSRLAITEIGADYVLGVWRDSLDVESLRVHSLTRR